MEEWQQSDGCPAQEQLHRRKWFGRKSPTYVAGSGDLDGCNDLTSPTPESPEGIYHYVISIEADSEGTISRYLDPHFRNDVRRTLKKNNLMPTSWTEDATYLEALKSGFSFKNVRIPRTDSFNTFVEFISSMQSTLESNGLSSAGAEFETMKMTIYIGSENTG